MSLVLAFVLICITAGIQAEPEILRAGANCQEERIYLTNGERGAVFCLDAGAFTCDVENFRIQSERPESLRVVNVTSVTLDKVMMQCKKQLTPSYRRKRRESVRWYRKSVYPGTRWCGEAITTDARADLNEAETLPLTDGCCKNHALGCGQPSDVVSPHTCLGNSQCKISLLTRFKCDCDDEFRRCLTGLMESDSDAERKAAGDVRDTYFNQLGTSCYIVEKVRKMSHDTQYAEHFNWVERNVWKPVSMLMSSDN